MQCLALEPRHFCSTLQYYQTAFYPTHLLQRSSSPTSGPSKPTDSWIISHHTQHLKTLLWGFHMHTYLASGCSQSWQCSFSISYTLLWYQSHTTLNWDQKSVTKELRAWVKDSERQILTVTNNLLYSKSSPAEPHTPSVPLQLYASQQHIALQNMHWSSLTWSPFYS